MQWKVDYNGRLYFWNIGGNREYVVDVEPISIPLFFHFPLKETGVGMEKVREYMAINKHKCTFPLTKITLFPTNETIEGRECVIIHKSPGQATNEFIEKIQRDFPRVRVYNKGIPREVKSLIEKAGRTQMYSESVMSSKNLHVMAFDLEVYASTDKFPDPKDEPESEIFQISLVDNRNKKYLLCTRFLSELELYPDACLIYCENEKQLIEQFVDVIGDENPDILLTYNGSGFDWNYVIQRSKLHNVSLIRLNRDLQKLYCPKKDKNGKIHIGIHGRIHIDLLDFIRTNFINLDSYKLSYVSSYFLGLEDAKLDVHHTEIKQAFQDPGQVDLLARVADYCIRDSECLIGLFEKLQVWTTATQLGNVTWTPIEDLYSRGTQVRTKNLIYSYLFRNPRFGERIIFAPERLSQGKCKYEGAFTMAIPGIYHNVCSFDFASLYPSIIMAYNVCPLAFINSNHNPKKDTLIPKIVKDLIEERKKVKHAMKNQDESSTEYLLNDKRQLSLKITANSIYGSLGASFGPISCLPAAEFITRKGREMVKFLISTLENDYHYKVVLADTDSSYCLGVPDHQEEIIAQEITAKINLPPIKLEFEKRFQSMAILARKHYMCFEPGKLNNPKLMGIGVKRRDRSAWTKEVFMKCMEKIVLDPDSTEQDIFQIIQNYWDDRKNRSIDDFVVTVQYSPDKKNSYFSEMFQRMKEKGLELFTGQRIEYLIVNGGKSDKMSSNVISKQEWEKHELLYSKYLQLAATELSVLMELKFGHPSKSFENRIMRIASGNSSIDQFLTKMVEMDID